MHRNRLLPIGQCSTILLSLRTRIACDRSRGHSSRTCCSQRQIADGTGLKRFIFPEPLHLSPARLCFYPIRQHCIFQFFPFPRFPRVHSIHGTSLRLLTTCECGNQQTWKPVLDPRTRWLPDTGIQPRTDTAADLYYHTYLGTVRTLDEIQHKQKETYRIQ